MHCLRRATLLRIQTPCLGCIGVVLPLLAIALLPGATLRAAGKDSKKNKPLPKFSTVETWVNQQLRSRSEYQDGDLITQSDVEAVFRKLAGAGWKVADREQIEELLLADENPMVRELRTPAGRKFMRKVSPLPLGFDRVDRLVRLSDGPRLVRRLVKGPDGHKMLDYLTTQPGGKEMGQMLSRAPGGADFNRPTGRIYTAEQLLARLKQSLNRAEDGGRRTEG